MTTPILALPELIQNQAQPHVPHNAALRRLEAVIQLTVISRAVTDAPGAPSNGDRYLIPAGGWGGGHDDQIAYYSAGWEYVQPDTGWLAWVKDEGKRYQFGVGSPSTWTEYVASGGGGSIAIVDVGSPTVLIPTVTEIIFANSLVEDLGGGIARVTPAGSSGGVAPTVTDLGMYFPGGPPLTAQLLFKYLAGRAMTFPGNFSGAASGHIGTNPAATFTMTVSVNGSQVGTIAVSTGGVFTFATTAGASIVLAAGDRLEIAAPVGTDGTAADIAVTLTASL